MTAEAMPINRFNSGNSDRIEMDDRKNAVDPSSVFLLIFIDPYTLPTIAASVSEMLIIIIDAIARDSGNSSTIRDDEIST